MTQKMIAQGMDNKVPYHTFHENGLPRFCIMDKITCRDHPKGMVLIVQNKLLT